MSDKIQLKKRTALGRGLSSLLEDNSKQFTELSQAQEHMGTILIERIELNPYQPRTHFDQDALAELAQSIKTQGLIQPIAVRVLDSETYQLISGERRLQACKLLGMTEISAYIRQADEQQMHALALIENVQREDLNPLEIAHSYQKLIAEFGLKQEETAALVGKNRASVANYLRLLKLPVEIQQAIQEDKISMGHARALINVADPIIQMSIFKKTIDNKLSVREVEELVRKFSQPRDEPKLKEKSPEKSPFMAQINYLERKLVAQFGTKVSIKPNKDEQSGEIKIPYLDAQDLERILEILNIEP